MLLKEKQDSEESQHLASCYHQMWQYMSRAILTNIYVTQLCGQHGSVPISLTPQGRGKAHTLVHKPYFEKDGGSWVTLEVQRWRTFKGHTLATLLYRAANFETQGLRSADPHPLKQGRKQEMSTLALLSQPLYYKQPQRADLKLSLWPEVVLAESGWKGKWNAHHWTEGHF